MGWHQEYEQKKMTAEEAVKHIRSGDRVVVAHAAGEPYLLTEAMVENHAAYRGVEVVHMVAMGKSRYCLPEMAPHFRHTSLFVGGTTREAINAGRGDFIPCYLHEVPQLFETALRPDVALLQVSPPDAHGYCSLGLSVDYTKSAAQQAKLRIAQVNGNMPRTLGDSFLHVRELDIIVEADTDLIELPNPPVGEIEKSIGGHCASLIRDGDTLQLGIGAIPNAMLTFLQEKNDLGIHSEMVSDGVMELMQLGVVNNTQKTLHPYKSVATFLMGTRDLYEFAHDNPAIAVYPVEYVNNPYVIAKNQNMVAVNSCVQVDLLGQVVSDCVGPRQISGVGGQVDFVRGANMSPGGRNIIAMPSQAKGGVSKIVAQMDAGAAVTTNRYDVDYIVTEYGIAQLKGKSLRQRAQELITIAHPDAREVLMQAYEQKFGEALPGN